MSASRTAAGTAAAVGPQRCVLAPHLNHELTTSPDGKCGRMCPDLSGSVTIADLPRFTGVA